MVHSYLSQGTTIQTSANSCNVTRWKFSMWFPSKQLEPDCYPNKNFILSKSQYNKTENHDSVNYISATVCTIKQKNKLEKNIKATTLIVLTSWAHFPAETL